MLRQRFSVVVALGLVGASSVARAQDIDLTYTQPPVVMLAIDTSGSMQFRGTGIIRDDRASPAVKCELSGSDKSREIVLKEVLTGTFNGYSLNVTSNNNNSGSNVADCTVGNHSPSYTSQASDGLLDSYRERLRFAFSTFDNNTGINNTSSGGDWSYPGTSSPAGSDGMFSKLCSGRDSTTACGSCSCPGGSGAAGCVRIVADPLGANASFTRSYCKGNVGIRSLSGAPCSGSSAGCLISAGASGSNIATQNDSIQTRVLAIASSGNTPLAGMLKDIRYWFDNHPDVKVDAGSSTFLKCRKNFTILMTDGIPNSGCGYSAATEGRPERCQAISLASACTTDLDCPLLPLGEWKCVSGQCRSVHLINGEVNQGPAYQAGKLLNPPSGGVSSIVHVVGFEFPSALTCSDNSHCPAGQTGTVTQTCKTTPPSLPSSTGKRCACNSDIDCDVGESCEPVPDDPNFKTCRLGSVIRSIATAGGGKALFANDPTSLRSAINEIFASLVPESTSRTRVSSTSAVAPIVDLPSQFPQPNKAALFIFQSAFTIPSTSVHWKGFLQRVSIGNKGTASSPVIGPLDQVPGVRGTVRFDELLNTQPDPVDDQGTAYTRKIYFDRNGSPVEFTRTNVAPSELGVSTTTERNNIVDFVRGEVGSARANNRLGAIYHSSPTILEPPILDLPIPSYQKYKQHPTLRQRPPMLFVGSNLGLLHAFNAMTGKEEWAFIPRALMGTLKQQLTGFTYGVDSTPVARDIQFSSIGQETDQYGNWRGVVVFGLGQGGTAIVALDVTTPLHTTASAPFSILWQFDQTKTVPANRLGHLYASPTVGTVFLDDTASGLPFQERAVAIIPGGGTPSGGTAGQGEDLWVIDLPTGNLIRRLPGVAGSGGMNATCAVLDDFPGSFLTRGFCGDNQGNLARINLSDPVAANWVIEPQWFEMGASGNKLPIFNAPALANRKNGNLMIIVGNGDQNDLADQADTAISFIEEEPVRDSGGAVTSYTATERKRLDLTAGEKLTGSPVVYNNVAYWATFVPDLTAACTFGRTRLWGVKFDEFVGTGPTAAFIPKLSSKCLSDGTFGTETDPTVTVEKCLAPIGSVSFGFDLVRTPSVVVNSSGAGVDTAGGSAAFGTSPTGTTMGGGLKLVFQTGTATLGAQSSLRDPELTPPGSQRVQVGALGVPDSQTRARIISWGRVTP